MFSDPLILVVTLYAPCCDDPCWLIFAEIRSDIRSAFAASDATLDQPISICGNADFIRPVFGDVDVRFTRPHRHLCDIVVGIIVDQVCSHVEMAARIWTVFPGPYASPRNAPLDVPLTIKF